MDFAALPPEINSGRMYSGPGAGPMMAAAAAWDALAAELSTVAAGYESAIEELTGNRWLGPSSMSMAAAAAPYVAWLHTTAMHAEQAAGQAKAAAGAYESAFAMIVPPPTVAANRSLLMSLIATNILGQNTPAIAATEADYAEMWAQDAAAMYGYAGSSATASTLTPFTAPPPTAHPAAAVAQALGASSGTPAQTVLSTGTQLISAVPQALQGLTAAVVPADFNALLTVIIIGLTAVDIPIATTAITASTTSATASFTSASTTYRGFLINADRDYAAGKGPFTGGGPGAAMVPQWLFGGPDALAEAATTATPVAAGIGEGTLVGGLSVPAGWASAAPAFRPAAYSLPFTASAAAAAPDIAATGSSTLFSEMALAGLGGSAVGNTATSGYRERVRSPATRARATQPPKSPGVPVPEITAELRELAARAQAILAMLHDSGILTDEEVTEEKRRFPGL